MRWLVEITDIIDKRFLTDLLSKKPVGLVLEENRTYLISDDFESLATCSEIWMRASEIRDVISEISSGVGADLSFKLGNVYEQKEDGSRSGTVFRSGSPPVLRLSVNGGGWTITPEISEEERLRLEVEQLEREYQNKLTLVSFRVLPALRDERALEVYRYLQQDLNTERMYKIYELIEDDLGRKLHSLASKNAWKRFRGSVNHPKDSGMTQDTRLHRVNLLQIQCL
ncbi:hypothetical protein [Stenomitos frigidus]|uniref:Uncharacterized protein n=1 Tax=Stenomitos frigidus ULC18 TaxID=2107698 RepID=A0A2T1EC85_9CYAN|nr:hypothetical protein [Stenomitos frigidus]PSB30340.1 hypothetical protein C7B82_09240 [Stenomitos frigidus ULC18]